MTCTITAGFSLGDKVRLIELNRPGRVTAIIFDDSGFQYQVDYLESPIGKSKSVWLFAHEIEVAP